MSSPPLEIKIISYGDVASTSSIAMELGEQGAAHGTVVVAATQSGGRGRRTRNFVSPPGGLYFSIILRPVTDPDHVSCLTIASGVACCQTVERVSGLPVMLKWPNDIYVGTRKLGGILTEAAPYSNVEQTIPFIVVGIGLNINTDPEKFPDSLRESITSLYYMQHQRYDPGPMMTDIVLQVDRYFRNPARLRDEFCTIWQQRDFLYGKKISWQGVRGDVIHGTGAGLMRDGRYQLQTTDGTIQPIIGGELCLD
jgi:BirA family biotin operon repressor/biotin-[acetyl-CoA-carboxylase] ligase